MIQTNIWTSVKCKAPFQVSKKAEKHQGKQEDHLEGGVIGSIYIQSNYFLFYKEVGIEDIFFIAYFCYNKPNTFHKEHFSQFQRPMLLQRSVFNQSV